MHSHKESAWTTAGRCAVRLADSIVNLAVLLAFLLMVAYGAYALWDAKQVYAGADASEYTVYKPGENDESESFEELRAINPEVFGWLTVYGTHIDYPLVQGDDNTKYVNMDAKGNYSLTGSIFLDCRNEKDFSDAVSIIYGHDMAEDKMFGELVEFQQKDYFDAHRNGKLYFGGHWYGIEFMAFVETDAYDTETYAPGTEAGQLPQFTQTLYAKATQKQQVDVAAGDHLVLLSTCTDASTNGRHILAGKIIGEVMPDPFEQSGKEKE